MNNCTLFHFSKVLSTPKVFPPPTPPWEGEEQKGGSAIFLVFSEKQVMDGMREWRLSKLWRFWVSFTLFEYPTSPDYHNSHSILFDVW